MSTLYSTALRAAIGLLLLGSLIVQVAIPVNARSAGEVFPEIEPLTMSYAILAIAAIVGVQVGLVATWRLASMVSKDRIFDRSALKWVNVIIVALIVSTALAASVFVHLIFIVQVGGPPALLGLGGAVALGVSLLLLLAVMRGLLAQAIDYRSELAGVV
ncbi:DUF2975 domain-containing protein [Nesterenkonia sp. LB17]|uniref:DUF2975 domain-containing protein n=1 Tax=Nesterenkonia sp. LB17 TaxID=2901230 RepID=UPI001F4C7360|nr:DUF2975 domain-containing protein [Nesterenkonia sp. LB17]MCH8564760.1 DUF2975 domain-containing protein [Nesterenkonia sp. LB17]